MRGSGNMEFPKGTRTENNPVFIKFFSMHKSMMRRCYSEKAASYKNYGGNGVTVDSEWHDLNNFLSTIDSVDGFNLEDIMEGKLQLDKDIKYPGNKVYSKDNCKFVTPAENSGFKPSVYREYVAVDSKYNIYEFTNVEKFSRDNNLIARNIWNCLNVGGRNTHRGWQFFYKEDFSEDKIIKDDKVAVSPELDIYEFKNISSFAKEHKLSAPNISMVLSGKNKHHKYWQFFYKEEFDENEVENVAPRVIIGISPDNTEYTFTNQTGFAREHNISQSGISMCLGGNKDTADGWKFKYK